MGLYADKVLPRILDVSCGVKQSFPLRERVCTGLRGRVVEIGFGSGHNVPFYPADVEQVTAVEPSDLAWKLASGRLAASSVPVRRAGLDGQSLPFPDHSFDAALSTWTLCTIPDPGLALAELRRVLRPGGTLHFLEHGLAPDAGVQRWQRRLEPLNKRVAGGCHLSRPVMTLLESAGFEVSDVDTFYEKGAPKALAAHSLGVGGGPPPPGGGPPRDRAYAKNTRRSATTASGFSRTATWPPCGSSDQCWMLALSRSARDRMVWKSLVAHVRDLAARYAAALP